MYTVLLDLDDTLYPERSYVRSGFQAVATALADNNRMRKQLEGKLMDLWKTHPTEVFDRFARMSDLKTLVHVPPALQLVRTYRDHEPKISLYRDAMPVMDLLRSNGCKLGIITDGRSRGQWAKLEALGLISVVDSVVVTDDLGPNRRFWKPHVLPFIVALDEVGGSPERAVYVGDNPAKDFHGPKQLGMRSVRIDRADALRLFSDTDRSSWESADEIVQNLYQFVSVLEQWQWI